MLPSEERFVRLVRLAQCASADAPRDELPLALATRTLARLRDSRIDVVSPWERLLPGAVSLAGIVAAVCLFLNSRSLQPLPTDERALAELILENQLEP